MLTDYGQCFLFVEPFLENTASQQFNFSHLTSLDSRFRSAFKQTTPDSHVSPALCSGTPWHDLTSTLRRKSNTWNWRWSWINLNGRNKVINQTHPSLSFSLFLLDTLTSRHIHIENTSISRGSDGVLLMLKERGSPDFEAVAIIFKEDT